jgi:hypothetical protein
VIRSGKEESRARLVAEELGELRSEPARALEPVNVEVAFEELDVAAEEKRVVVEVGFEPGPAAATPVPEGPKRGLKPEKRRCADRGNEEEIGDPADDRLSPSPPAGCSAPRA